MSGPARAAEVRGAYDKKKRKAMQDAKASQQLAEQRLKKCKVGQFARRWLQRVYERLRQVLGRILQH